MPALAYTSVDRLYDILPEVGSDSTLTSAQILTAFAIPAESEINARISRLYAVPVPGVVPLLEAIADDLAMYRILSRRIMTRDMLKDSGWTDRFKEARETLDAVATGKTLLVNSAGDLIGSRTDVAEVRSNVSAYQPTFHEGSDLDHVIDKDKIDDILSDRDLK